MVASVVSCLLQGLEGRLVEVQADASPGRVVFNLVGLADTGVKEARERVRSAIRNSGLPFPTQRLTVNLAPAELRKEGGGFDLPVAVAISLAMSGGGSTEGAAFVGELALDGSVRHVDGVLVAARALRQAGIETLYLGVADAAEAGLVEGLKVVAVPDLAALMAHLRGGEPLPARVGSAPSEPALAVPPTTWPRCTARRLPGGRWSSRLPAATTCCSAARPVRGRRCWRAACPASCRR